MTTWRLTVRYDGARYRGWQRLGKDAGGPTIQSKIEGVLATLCDEKILVTGSGRTDAGVHALAQVAHFRCEARLDSDAVLEHCARYLPDDIAVVAAEVADDRFHARYRAKEKTYLYRIDTARAADPFERKYAWHVAEALDWTVMERAAGQLVGRHDFQAFTSMKSKTKSAEKTIRRLDIGAPQAEKPMATLRISADGFLHNMVRIIVGTLVDVGLGRRTPESIAELLDGGRRSEAGPRAPSKGLFLEHVEY